MTQLHPRIAFLADLLGLRPPEGDGERGLTELLLCRLEEKCQRLRNELPGLTFSASEATIARACAIPKWRLLIHELAEPACFTRFPSGRWSVADVLPAAVDVDSIELPLNDGQRLYARHFAMRLAKALALEQPAAHDLAARLYGAESWLALAGNIPFLAPDEPLYTYQKTEPGTDARAALHPSRGCVRLAAELTALTYLAHPEARAHAARHALTRRPDFLTAARIAVDALIEQEADQEALDCGNRTLRAVSGSIIPTSARLDACSPANIEYWRLRCARVIALRQLERFDDADDEKVELVAKLIEAGATGEALVAQWLAEYRPAQGLWPQATTCL
ncbi:hypothetical protein [Paraburkholderia sp. RL17-337-BIB-A]|uniref:hypothetical protein n=1 Tax=Paraburkholderia sp. RL17-337-BIB-A TaxID=3031636 RepID=UPI0038B90D30